MHGLKRSAASSVDETLRFADHFMGQPAAAIAARLGVSAAQAQGWQAAVAELAASTRRRRRAMLRHWPASWVRPARQKWSGGVRRH
jgi:hypothetical protein